jgi:hypothetical protein
MQCESHTSPRPHAYHIQCETFQYTPTPKTRHLRHDEILDRLLYQLKVSLTQTHKTDL